MQKTPTHTPGPWKVTGLSRHGFYCKVRGTRLGGKFQVAHCPFVPDSREDKVEAEANARLIAAAPHLLEALQTLADYAEGIGMTPTGVAFANARIAIAEATKDEPANNAPVGAAAAPDEVKGSTF